MDVVSVKIADDEARRKPRISSMGRSAALEQAYVHDVYEICNEVVSPLRPRVTQFLTSLEPGSVVCDVGCGNGRYLTPTNSFIYSIGIDRCHRLSQAARSRGNEIALCDNLELPFRNESFDAVLSLAVVHHFATKDRRVEAIKEIARILRIGGRAIITVWALEQRNRRFESQDILIPWQLSSAASASDDDDDEDFLPPYSAYSEDSTTTSSRSAGDGDSSSLSSSSPVESCCIFMRRAIQKLASGKKNSWFLDSINAKDNKLTTGWDVEDAKNLPIELRRLEDFDDVAEPFRLDPLAGVLPSPATADPPPPPPPPPPRVSTRILTKQASLNEDLMAESRQRDREGVRKRIQKQASLNESFLCRSLSKRLQLLGHGLGGALKSSTEGLERATKTSLGRIIKTMASNGRQELIRSGVQPGLVHTPSDDADGHPVAMVQLPNDTTEIPPMRHTHESESDSSKESSLQSDTSVESEDSFASVIYVPNAEQKVNPSPPPTQSPAPKFDAFPEECVSPVAKVPPSRPPPSPAPSSRKPPPMPYICEERRLSAQSDDETQCLINRVLVRGKMDARARMKAYFSARTTSLDIYHPETDDLESDSTEPSSPDSVDSVVSALKLDEAVCGLTSMRLAADSAPPEPVGTAVEKVPVDEGEKEDTKPEEKTEEEVDEMICRQFLVDYADRLSTKLLEDVNGKLTAHSFALEKNAAPEELPKSPQTTRLSPREFTLPLNTGLNGACGPQNSETVMNRERTGAKNLRPPKGGGGAKPKTSQKGNFSFDFRTEADAKARTETDAASVGGSATHHRYYHVFREGELEALINHNVTSLHIVSSYYERASWCVVAEKVQVWTI
ncbi:uncharacterized protein LOC129794988 [Lutzomyia longipalpis]|uniref:uncharacterized protein LOC129794988 n=1 Tax=Lutzomyia longipalpis TaxID=7200 RepID=UPI002483F93F|nr:uncharacterized protein LOC129794988 [Lutzomyia longipalpis]